MENEQEVRILLELMKKIKVADNILWDNKKYGSFNIIKLEIGDE